MFAAVPAPAASHARLKHTTAKDVCVRAGTTNHKAATHGAMRLARVVLDNQRELLHNGHLQRMQPQCHDTSPHTSHHHATSHIASPRYLTHCITTLPHTLHHHATSHIASPRYLTHCITTLGTKLTFHALSNLACNARGSARYPGGSTGARRPAAAAGGGNDKDDGSAAADAAGDVAAREARAWAERCMPASESQRAILACFVSNLHPAV
jgi:hypothetical protein